MSTFRWRHPGKRTQQDKTLPSHNLRSFMVQPAADHPGIEVDKHHTCAVWRVSSSL